MLSDLRSWAPELLTGLRLTVGMTFGGMAIALVLGLILALGRISHSLWLRAPVVAFVELIRGSPLLLQLFYIYYVLPVFGLRMTPVEAGLLGLGINYGAYLSEVFRGGIAAVSQGQREAAESLGMSGAQTMRFVILPQAWRIVIPPTGNYFVSLFKDTALVSTISIAELMFQGQLIASDTFRYMRIYSVIFVIYVAISVPASMGVRWLERRSNRSLASR
uniref:ectoine/hydroxyectoine ABC transporter permease subunit EhuD n=1 Tax=Acidisoma silvae TaxID=2802396 RepID=UPI001D0A7484|nr:ectoine/hydroxyectoine ABC transporter permease subunit EhuD [Acidisoma silvae]